MFGILIVLSLFAFFSGFGFLLFSDADIYKIQAFMVFVMGSIFFTGAMLVMSIKDNAELIFKNLDKKLGRDAKKDSWKCPKCGFVNVDNPSYKCMKCEYSLM